MDFFNSLSTDLKLLAIGIAVCALLALFTSNPKMEKRFLFALALFAAVGVYRFMHTAGYDQSNVAATPVRHIAEPKHVPIVSTGGK
jgi:hypothetical protein